MSLAELLPSVQHLSRVEKLRLLQVLTAELSSSEEATALQAGQTYPIWSPHDAYDAAETLLSLLDKERTQP